MLHILFLIMLFSMIAFIAYVIFSKPKKEEEKSVNFSIENFYKELKNSYNGNRHEIYTFKGIYDTPSFLHELSSKYGEFKIHTFFKENDIVKGIVYTGKINKHPISLGILIEVLNKKTSIGIRPIEVIKLVTILLPKDSFIKEKEIKRILDSSKIINLKTIYRNENTSWTPTVVHEGDMPLHIRKVKVNKSSEFKDNSYVSIEDIRNKLPEMINSGNIFISGSSGSGKSQLVAAMLSNMPQDKEVYLMSSTDFRLFLKGELYIHTDNNTVIVVDDLGVDFSPSLETTMLSKMDGLMGNGERYILVANLGNKSRELSPDAFRSGRLRHQFYLGHLPKNWISQASKFTEDTYNMTFRGEHKDMTLNDFYEGLVKMDLLEENETSPEDPYIKEETKPLQTIQKAPQKKRRRRIKK